MGIIAGVAQWFRAFACQAKGRRFKSGLPLQTIQHLALGI